MLRVASRLRTAQPIIWERSAASGVAIRSFCTAESDVDIPVDDRIGVTWKYQDDLPILPLPGIQETCQRYRELLSPLLTEQEFAEANKHITKFEGTSIANDLQTQLLELQSTETSWLEGFWDKMYLDIRDPLPINVNPFFIFKHSWQERKENSTAAKLVTAFSKANKLIKMRKFPPDMEGSRPLCMYQYSKLFGCTRYPRIGADVFASNRYGRHIIVMRREQMFSLVIENEKQQLLPYSTIRAGLDTICEMADKNTSPVDPVGYFTTSERDEWAKNYQKLQQASEQNKSNLALIGGALMVLNLEHDEFETLERASESIFHNRGANRWFDKLQLIVDEEGTAGLNMEHTPIDGHTLVRVATDMHDEMLGNGPYEDLKVDVADLDEAGPPPTRINWDLNDELRDSLQKAKSEFEEFSGRTETIPLIEDVGKRLMKRFNTSPDAFVQMAIQLAYYRETGGFDSTYESALTKQFLHGRTETIRTVTEQSKDYCRKFDEEKLIDSGAVLVETCKKHSQISKMAKNGQGVDRHLFGLYSLAKKEKMLNPDFQIPSIFTSPAYSKYGSNIISTSNCGSHAIELFGFGPVHPEGVGVGYLIHDNTTNINVTGINGKAGSFANTLREAFRAQIRAARANQESVAAAAAAAAAAAEKEQKENAKAAAVDSTSLPPKE